MTDRSKRPRAPISRGGTKARSEWVGGLLEPPFFIMDRDEPYRPLMALWVELPEGLIVGHASVPPEERFGALGKALLEAMEEPLVGPPRRPSRIRVCEETLAAEVRRAVGAGVPVDVAPTPELDELLKHMMETMPEGDLEGSYLMEGRISPDLVADLFSGARRLYQAKPWERLYDSQPLKMDIPHLGVEGACVTIIGMLGESLGILMFPDIESYERFSRAADDQFGGREPMDLGTEWLALTFERGAELSAIMRREVVT